jgi:hypothetical protein
MDKEAMPLHVEKVTNGVFLVKDNKGEVYGKHKTRLRAEKQIYIIQMDKQRWGE